MVNKISRLRLIIGLIGNSITAVKEDFYNSKRMIPYELQFRNLFNTSVNRYTIYTPIQKLGRASEAEHQISLCRKNTKNFLCSIGSSKFLTNKKTLEALVKKHLFFPLPFLSPLKAQIRYKGDSTRLFNIIAAQFQLLSLPPPNKQFLQMSQKINLRFK